MAWGEMELGLLVPHTTITALGSNCRGIPDQTPR